MFVYIYVCVCALFFSVCGAKDKRAWIYVWTKSNQLKAEATAQKDGLSSAVVVEIINAANVNEFFFMPLVSRTHTVDVYATVDNIDGNKTASF